MTNSDGQITEESIEETPRSSEQSARVVSFDDNDQIVDSPPKPQASRNESHTRDNSTQHLLPSSALLKQTPSYSQKKRERRNRKKEFEMRELASKQRVQ